MHKLTLTFSLVAAVAALMLTSAAASARITKKSVGLLSCSGQAQVKPADYTLFCGDGNDTLAKLHWHDWGHASATASGVDGVNLCAPSCAAGKLRNYAVSVTASKLKSSDYHLLTIRFLHHVPPGLHRTEKFTVSATGPVIK
jgi:hypothetical protein